MGKLAKLPSATTFDKIRKQFIEGDNSVKLTEKELKQKERWQAAFALLCNTKKETRVASMEDARKMLQEVYEISQAQAYRDVSNALKLFGDIFKSTHKGRRYILFEHATELFNLALEQKNLSEANSAMRNMIKLLPEEEFDEKQIEAHVYQLKMPTAVLEFMKQQTAQGVINLNNSNIPGTEDVQYEEVKNEQKAN